jgi:hypothetical protein
MRSECTITVDKQPLSLVIHPKKGLLVISRLIDSDVVREYDFGRDEIQGCHIRSYRHWICCAGMDHDGPHLDLWDHAPDARHHRPEASSLFPHSRFNSDPCAPYECSDLFDDCICNPSDYKPVPERHQFQETCGSSGSRKPGVPAVCVGIDSRRHVRFAARLALTSDNSIYQQ